MKEEIKKLYNLDEWLSNNLTRWSFKDKRAWEAFLKHQKNLHSVIDKLESINTP